MTDIGLVGQDMPIEYLLSQKRAGIVPYRIDKDGSVHLMWGVDTLSNDLTDFGGRTESKDRDSIDTAIREFKEETYGAFGNVTREQLGRSIAIYRKDILMVFVRINYDVQQVMNKFVERSRLTNQTEITSLIELDRYEFMRVVFTPPHGGLSLPHHMYELIRILLQDAFISHGNFL